MNLKEGDKVAIIAPAKAIEPEYISHAIDVLRDHGYDPIVGRNCLKENHYFSGTMEERTADMQEALDNPEIKAIFCARGGYGSIQIMDQLHWDKFLLNPKWIVGFSDITVFHQFCAKNYIPSLHATMPLNYKDNSMMAFLSMFSLLETGTAFHQWNNDSKFSRNGTVEGQIIGGNLSVLTHLIGTSLSPSFQNKILFIEEVGEHLYAIDRLLYQLKYAGIFNQINGLIVGDFSNIKDTQPPFGKTLQEIILSFCQSYDFPIAFNFPAGHTKDNWAIAFGKKAIFSVKENNASLDFL